MQKITKKFIRELSDKACQSGRKRVIHTYHTEASDLIQRMLNVMEPETYSRPHKHLTPIKREAFVILTGRVAVLEFDEDGKISDLSVLSHESGNFGAEIVPGAWHALVCLENGSALYEVKDGPYIADEDKVFAPWSPEEYCGEAVAYLEGLKNEIRSLANLD